MLILILIDIKYLQSVAFRFGKGSSGQNYSLSDSQHPINPPPPLAKFPIPPYVLTSLKNPP